MNYLYYHKRFNEASATTNWVCSEAKCSKKLVSVDIISETHPTHQPLNDIDLLCMDFKQQLKETVKDGSKSIREHYKD